ncbi:unnamed protein product, partial [Ectocarpus sp. 12 AP-2014]
MLHIRLAISTATAKKIVGHVSAAEQPFNLKIFFTMILLKLFYHLADPADNILPPSPTSKPHALYFARWSAKTGSVRIRNIRRNRKVEQWRSCQTLRRSHT